MRASRATWLGVVVLGAVVVGGLVWLRHATPAWLGGPDGYGAAAGVVDDAGPHRLRLFGLYGGHGCAATYRVSAGVTRGGVLDVTVATYEHPPSGACSATLFGASATVTYRGDVPTWVRFARASNRIAVVRSATLPHIGQDGWQVSGELVTADRRWYRCFRRPSDTRYAQVCLDQRRARQWRDQPYQQHLVVAGRPVTLDVRQAQDEFALVGTGPEAVVLSAFHLDRAEALDVIASLVLPAVSEG